MTSFHLSLFFLMMKLVGIRGTRTIMAGQKRNPLTARTMLPVMLASLLPRSEFAWGFHLSSLTSTSTSTTMTRRVGADLISRRSTRSGILLFSSSSSSSSSFSSKAAAADTSSTQYASSVLASRLDGLDRPTVWHEFSPLSVEHGSMNLGQGFPDWDPPQFCIEAMEQATNPKYGRHSNQYARPNAHLALANNLAQDYSERWQMEINPFTQIASATGCTNALYCALQGLINPGDEVILLEPAFDIYSSQVAMAGGQCVYCPLRPTTTTTDHRTDDTGNESKSSSTTSSPTSSTVFQLDLDELESKITSRTKLLILNTPHNPTGKMFSKQELQGIANIVLQYPQLNVISDEVYEHLVFNPQDEPHISMATIPEMMERTLTLSSSGKTFSCTGWKVGWAVGPPHLVKAVVAAQQWVNFSAATPNQDAIAQSLQQAREPYIDPNGGDSYSTYYEFLANDYKRKRQLLMDALSSAGMTPLLPPGGFFVMADTTGIDDDLFYKLMAAHPTPAMPSSPMPRDWALARWLTQEVGVTAIPPSAFYSPPNVPLAKNLLRFAFCKSDDTLLEAHRRLESFFSSK